MNFEHWLVVVAVGVSAAGYIPYIRDTLKGKTKPNRVSWSLWAFMPFVAAAAAISAGADLWPTVRTILAGFLPLIVFFLSFVNRQSYWRLTFFDFLCGVCALIAILIWILVDLPRYALLFALAGDIFASLPTVYKCWKFPQTETAFTFLMALLSSLIVLPSIPVWNLENSAFQIYLVAANAVFTFGLFRKRIFAVFKLDSRLSGNGL